MHLSPGAATTLKQLLRFGVVGVGLNAALFGVYLGLAGRYLNPKLAMTGVYAAGVVLGFVLNRRWSFSSPALRQGLRYAGLRYALVCIGSYGVNLGALVLFVDRLGWPHRWVQGTTVLVIAGASFVLNKFWVFGAPNPADHGR